MQMGIGNAVLIHCKSNASPDARAAAQQQAAGGGRAAGSGAAATRRVLMVPCSLLHRSDRLAMPEERASATRRAMQVPAPRCSCHTTLQPHVHRWRGAKGRRSSWAGAHPGSMAASRPGLLLA